MFLDCNLSPERMLIPKSKFVELFKGNKKFRDEVISQIIVLKVELPEISSQGGTVLRPQNSFLTWKQKCAYVQHQNLCVQIYACSLALYGMEAIGNNHPSFCLMF